MGSRFSTSNCGGSRSGWSSGSSSTSRTSGGSKRRTRASASTDCQRVSHDLSALLDVEDEFGQDDLGETYTLEVSSPGLDRPLRHEADYRRFTGRLAKIVTSEPIGRQSAFAGRITGVDEGAVVLEEGRKTHRVPLDRIKRANLDVEF